MPSRYSTYNITDLGLGLDRYRSLDSISDGYMSSIKNMDPMSSGKLQTRKGYEQYHGCVPLRASSFSKTGTTYTIEFDASSTIDLGSVASGPIVVAGKIPSDAGAAGADFSGEDFSTSFAAHWYSDFTVGVRETFASGSPATHSKTADDTGITQANVFVGWHESDSTATLDNTLLTPEAIAINQSTYQIDMDYEAATAITGIFTWKSVPATAGLVHIESVTAQTSVTIAESTHNLNNASFIIRCWKTGTSASHTWVDGDVTVGTDTIAETSHGLRTGLRVVLTTTGTLPAGLALSTTYWVIRVDDDNYKLASSLDNANAGTAVDITAAAGGGTHTTTVLATEVLPETATANSTTGDITVTFTDAFTGNIIVYAAENDHIASAVSGDQTLSVTGVTSPFNFWELWAVSGTTRTMVTPEEITWDAATQTASIDYVGPGAESVEIFWTSAEYQANSIDFEGTDGGVDFDTNSPEITVWGICHSGIYKSGNPQGGFTNHLDNYRSETADKMVTGLGGNMFLGQTYADAGATYKMSSLHLRGSNRVSGAHILAPLFSGDSPGYTRTRGNVTDSSIDGDGYAKCTTVAWSSGTSVDYTLEFDDDMTGTVSLGTEVSANDWLTIRNCGHDRNNGTFQISAVSISTTSITFTVTNAAATDATQDESNISAQANVFTDEILLSGTPIFLVGDKVISNDTSANVVKSVDAANNKIYIDGISTNSTISDGLNIYTRRTSDVLPLQLFPNESVGDDTNGGMVIGDNLVIGGVTQSPKIKYINDNATGAASISVSSGTATVTLTDHNLSVGQKIVLYATNDTDIEGTFTITDIPTVNTFEFTTTAADGSPTATMLGKTVEIDESIQLDSGPTLISVETQGRWTPIENPGTSQSRGLETKTRHWDELSYVAQNYLRSVIVNDSMFQVNDSDEVKKFDGTNLTNAGLVPWQAWGFLTVDATNTALQVGASVAWDNGSSNPNADGFFVIGANVLPVGSRFKSSASSTIYTVSLAETDDVDTTRIYVEEAINASDNTSTGTLTRSNIFRYYARLNAVDVNRNIVASAMLGSEDLFCETFTSSAIQLKVISLPPFAEIDYDRIEVEIYRTKRNTPAPFYRVYRRLIDYGDLGGYLTWTDTILDEQLGSGQFDIAPAGFNSAELGNQWDSPPLASAVTTVDNRLVLANIKSPPIMDVVFSKDSPESDLVVGDFSSGTVELVKNDSTSGSETFNDAMVFEFLSSGETTLTPATDIAVADSATSHTWVDGDVTVGTDQIAETSHGLRTGVKVRLTTTGTLPAGLAAATTYYVIRVDANNYKLASSLANACAGTAVDITAAAGGGTHTTTVHGDHIVIQDATIGGLTDAQWVYLFHSAAGETNLLDFAGWYRITEADNATGSDERAIINMNHTRTTGLAGANDVDRFIVTSTSTFTVPLRVPVWIGTDGNFNQLYHDNAAIETRVSSRLALAINAVQSSDDPANTYWADTTSTRPTPWLMARAGLSFATGTMELRLVDNPSASFTIEHNGLGTNTKTFVNNTSLAAAATASSEIRLFNSRLSVSYPNFPEIHDNPFSTPAQSDSIIDVNPSDGQEITSVMPFFGQSAFGSANLAQAVAVFKTSSVYLVDVKTRQWQRLHSQAQGCTAPRSTAVTQDGIMFANESGIYKLGWDMKVRWVGRMINDLWKDDLDLTDIAEFAGHNYKQNRQYKLGVVTSGNDYNSNVVVYDHTRESGLQDQTSLGSWTEYTNHAVTGWANQSQDAYWGNQSGQVWRIRNYGTSVDYRDDASAIDDQQFITGGIHYGLPGNRKTTSAITIQYQNDTDLTDINISTEQSLSGTFNASTQTDISGDNVSVKYSLVERKGTFLRVKLTKTTTKDERLEVSRITFHARDIGELGTPKAANTT